MDFQYQYKVANATGDLCDHLKLKVKKDAVELHSGDLKTFSYSAGLFSSPKELEFEAELSGSGAGLEGKKCDFDFVFEGWQEDFANFGDGGFWDEETISNEIESGIWTKNVVINEMEYDSVQTDTDSDYEWFEIYNPNDNDITLKNWTITDNYRTDTIPDITITKKGYAVIAAKETGFKTNYSSFSGNIVYISDGEIGGGLSNTDDRLTLKNEKDEVVDRMSYGGDVSAFNLSCSDVAVGHSLGRSPDGKDTTRLPIL